MPCEFRLLSAVWWQEEPLQFHLENNFQHVIGCQRQKSKSHLVKTLDGKLHYLGESSLYIQSELGDWKKFCSRTKAQMSDNVRNNSHKHTTEAINHSFCTVMKHRTWSTLFYKWDKKGYLMTSTKSKAIISNLPFPSKVLGCFLT